MAIPGIVQHVVWSTNSNNEAAAGNAFVFRYPNATLSNNCLVLFLYYPSGATLSTIAGNVNSWSTTPAVTITDTSNSIITAVFVLPGATSGDTQVTVTFSGLTYGVRAAFVELYNIATSTPADGNASVFNVTTNPQAAGPVTTTQDGDLILHFGHDTGNGQTLTAGVTDGLKSITRDPFCTLLQADLVHGYFLEYRVQDKLGAINPRVTLTTKSNGGYSNLLLALKSASAGTAPAASQRVFGLMHTHFIGTGAAGNIVYPFQFPCFGNAQAVEMSDPKSSIEVISVAGSSTGSWTTYAPDPAAPTGAHVDSLNGGVPSGDDMLTLTIHDASTHQYIQGIFWDVINSGGFDSAAFGTSSASFGPGNTPSVLSFTPTASAGVAIGCMELGTGPPDSLVTPAGFFACVNYTHETDLSMMDNGDCHGAFTWASTAAQNWVWHDTAACSGCGGIVIGFAAGPVITANPTNQYAQPGQSATFSVTATASAGSVTYQWYRNGSIVTGATSASYTFTPNYPGDYAAIWSCKLTDTNGVVQSLPVQILWVLESFGKWPTTFEDDGSQDYLSELTLLRWF